MRANAARGGRREATTKMLGFRPNLGRGRKRGKNQKQTPLSEVLISSQRRHINAGVSVCQSGFWSVFSDFGNLIRISSRSDSVRNQSRPIFRPIFPALPMQICRIRLCDKRSVAAASELEYKFVMVAIVMLRMLSFASALIKQIVVTRC